MGRHNSGAAGADSGSFGVTPRDAGTRRRGVWVWGLGAVLIVLALVAGLFVWRSGTGDGCGGERSQISVAADPAIADALRDAAAKVAPQACADYRVDPVAGADVPGLLTSGDKRPDLWVPDSAVQARRVSTQVRHDLDLVADSLASTPTVVVGKKLPKLTSWVQVMKLPDLRTGNPIDTSTGDAAIVGALAEVDAGELTEAQFTEAMTVLAVQQNNARLANDSEGARLNLANTSEVPVVTTEQQFATFMRTHADSQLALGVPADGTVLLDYPLVNTASAARQSVAAQAGEALAAAVAGDGRDEVNRAGFRLPGGQAAPGDHPNGTGEAIKVLSLDDPAQVDKALRQWQVLGVPIRTLVVEDTSGSMETSVGDSTRAELLIQASLTGLKLFPNNAMIGGWAFSQGRSNGQDWEELGAIRRLDAKSASGTTHREQLAAAVEQGLAPENLGGATGLYDTTLAAFKKVQDTYDPNYSNSVIIMTDGQNEDPNSIGLDELIAELKRLEDPARPVLILTIGISDDADTDALAQIAEATGGTTYVATDADDIRSVFVNAIAARVAAAGR